MRRILFRASDIAVVNTIKELLFDVRHQEEMEVLFRKLETSGTMATFMLLWHHYLEKRGRKPLFEFT